MDSTASEGLKQIERSSEIKSLRLMCPLVVNSHVFKLEWKYIFLMQTPLNVLQSVPIK